MAEGSSYLTHVLDQAVEGVKNYSQRTGIVPAPLPANVNNSNFNTAAGSAEGHGMREYLAIFRTQLISMAVQAKARAFQPVPVGTGGLISASMVWSNYQDLDLHVFEPNSHVFILQRNGTNG